MTETNLKKIMAAKGISKVELANRVGVTRQAVGLWEKSGRFSSSTLPKVAEALGVSVGELLGDAVTDGAPVVRVVPDSHPRAGFRRIPCHQPLDTGAIREGREIVDGYFDFAEWFLRGIAWPDIEGLELWSSGVGNSMSPTITNRALFLVDTHQKTITSSGGIYCVIVNDCLMIRRLQLVPEAEKVRVTADNPNYRDILLGYSGNGKMEDSRIIGRVVYIFNGSAA